MSKLKYGPPDGDADRREYAQVAATAFGANPDDFRQWIHDQPADNTRILRDGKRIVGGLVVYRAGQYFGGRSVPTWGIAGVSVSPELRGKGIARTLMKECLAEAAEEGIALSTLYPATQRLYRNLGWEIGGRRVRLRVPVKDLPAHPTPNVEQVAADDPRIHELYSKWAATRPGTMDRSPPLWMRIRRAPKDQPVYTWLATEDGKPAGYLMYVAQREGTVLNFDIFVRDFVWLNPDARDQLIGLLAGQRTVTTDTNLPVADDDPAIASILPGHSVRVADHMLWMLRIVNVRAALAGRGWPPIDASLEFRVTDTEVAANHGGWKLDLKLGVPTVTVSKAKSLPVIDVRGLAALFSGRVNADQARAMGLLTGPTDQDGLIAAVFAGASPWMPDFF